MSRALRRRLERELQKQGVSQSPLTTVERRGVCAFDRRFPGVLRRHFTRFPVDVQQLERESDEAIAAPRGSR